MRVLALESSCDETGSAILEKTKNSQINILSNLLDSSSRIHSKTGGIIPENAAREQIKVIIPLIVDSLLAFKKSKIEDHREKFIRANEILKKEIDAIAVTQGPGLIGSLLVGVETAKTLSFAFNKAIIPVNHLLGHLYANFIGKKIGEIKFPLIGLIVSGGHTDLLYFKSLNQYKWLGGTRDDAAGEALDKIGRLLNLSYPAGAEIEKRARKAKGNEIKFKSPLIHSNDFDFSFSGLKTEALRFIQDNEINEKLKNEICFAVEEAVIESLSKKTIRAVNLYKVNTLLLGGGVSANKKLRDKLKQESETSNLKLEIFTPPKELCTDNAAMIGAQALIDAKNVSWNTLEAKPDLYFA